MNIEKIKQVLDKEWMAGTFNPPVEWSEDGVYHAPTPAQTTQNAPEYVERHNLDDLRKIVEQDAIILAQHEELERLRGFIKRYRYRIAGGEPMQKYIDECVLSEPKEQSK